MKKLTKILTVLLTVSLLASLIPALSLFAEEEINSLPVQTEQIVYEEAETPAAEEETVSEDAGDIPGSEEAVSEEPEEPEQETEESAEPSEKKEDEKEDKIEDEEAELSDLNKLDPSVTILAAVSEEKMGAGEKEQPAEGDKIELAITNKTGMFNAVSAYLETKDGQTALVVALSGTGYHELFVGTYEQAVANGANTDNWIHGAINADGKWEFRIPVSSGESYIPIVAISDSYYTKYLNGGNAIERAFYPRQFTLDTENKTLVTDDFGKIQELAITNNVKMFKPSAAALETVGGPNSNNYKSNLILTMGSESFDKVCFGTKDQADSVKQYEAAGGTTFEIPVRWVEEFGKPETMRTVIGTPVVMSFHSVGKNEWYERKMTINEEAGTITFDEVKEDEDPSGGGDIPIPTPTPPAPAPDGGGDDGGTPDSGGGNTAAVDNSTGLADGVYKPDRFAFSGGSGRIIITCDQVEVIGGKAYATIRFQNLRSGSTEMNYVKASGGIFYCSQDGGASVVRIPVELNKNNQILALTTKMSAAHEIAYTLFIYIAGADAQKTSTLTDNKELDKEAPVIAGLEYQGEEVLEKAEFFKIFNYSDGIRLIEIDMRLKEKDPNYKDVKEAKDKEAASADTKGGEEAADDAVIDEETGEEVAVLASKAEAQAKLYKGNIIKYLVVPENVEIPAGLDKETIVIQLPLKSVYSGADAISGIFEKLAIKDRIKSQPKEDKDNKEIVAAGEFKDLNLKKLIKSKCDLILLPEDCVKDKKARETFEEMTEDLANLEVPVLVDRSEYEENDAAKAEWLKIYGILFGCEDAANAAMQEAKK